MSLRLLLVEDDRELRSTLRSALMIEGHEVITAASLSEANAIYNQTQLDGETKTQSFDLILLDLGLPDGDGSELLNRLRRRQNTPVIIISAREAEGQKIELLDAGADDYLVKPFSIGELLARIRVAMRHRGAHLRPAITRYEYANLCIDLANHSVVKNGEAIHLTPTEFNLLARLVRSAGQVVNHRQLLVDVWGQEYLDHTHYLRLYMGQLRAKLERNPARPKFLLTEPGIGYRLLDNNPE
ncbi:MAG: two-component system response regulator KdpE [Cellvibrio sp. 79]|nr:MAG: two-component system response regulator KdpE [Cellvibrio sp. 79]